MSVYPGPPGPSPPGFVSDDAAYPPRDPPPGPSDKVPQALPPAYAGLPKNQQEAPPADSQGQHYPGHAQHGSNPYGGYMNQPGPHITVLSDGWGRPAAPVKPASYLGLSIFVLLCCNLLFGIVAVILSAMSDSDYGDNNLEGAACKGRAALAVNIVGIVLSCLGGTVIIIVLVFAVGSVGSVASVYG